MTMKKVLFLIAIISLVSNNLLAQISIQQEKAGVWILDGKRKLGYYQIAEAGINKEVGRANYWHPLYLPDGSVLTEDRPADHPLHRGIFLAWHQVYVGKQSVGDSWILKDVDVKVKKTKFKKIDNTKGQFETVAEWQSPLWKNGKSFVEESTKYVFHTQNSNFNVIRIEITLKALTDSVFIGGSDDSKGYGGFSVRMKVPEDIQFFSAGGEVTPMNDAVEAGQYMNIFGTLTDDNQQGGVMIYADPENQEGPQTWILRNRRNISMQNPVYPGRTQILIPKDKPVKLVYYLVPYTGKIDPERIIKEYNF